MAGRPKSRGSFRSAGRKVVYRVARAAGRRRTPSGAGASGNLTDGVIAGALRRLLPTLGLPIQGPLADAAVLAGVGYYRGNPVLLTMAGVQIGDAIASGGFGGIFGNAQAQPQVQVTL